MQRVLCPLGVLSVIACLWAIGFLLPSRSDAAAAASPPSETVEVIVHGTGQASLKGATAAARTVALTLAKRDAAERALGASVSLTSIPDLRRVISQVEGTLTYHLLREEQEEEFFTVVILATVRVPKALLEAHPLTPEERETESGFTPLVQTYPDGLIDWQDGYVLAYGRGRAPAGMEDDRAALSARRAAVADAQAKALELVAGVSADAERRTRDLTGEAPILRLRLEGRVREAEVVREERGDPWLVVIRVPLHGIQGISVLLYDSVAGEAALPPLHAPGPAGGFSGLLVDARGTGLSPALFPRLLDPSGSVLYSVQSVQMDAFLRRGVVGYAIDEAEGKSLAGGNPFVVKVASLTPEFPVPALESSETEPLLWAEDAAGRARRKRQGQNPLKVRGLNAAGTLRANLVISAQDASRIASDPSLAMVLRESRVIVITDPMVGGSEGMVPGPQLAQHPRGLP